LKIVAHDTFGRRHFRGRIMVKGLNDVGKLRSKPPCTVTSKSSVTK